MLHIISIAATSMLLIGVLAIIAHEVLRAAPLIARALIAADPLPRADDVARPFSSVTVLNRRRPAARPAPRARQRQALAA